MLIVTSAAFAVLFFILLIVVFISLLNSKGYFNRVKDRQTAMILRDMDSTNYSISDARKSNESVEKTTAELLDDDTEELADANEKARSRLGLNMMYSQSRRVL